MNKEKQLKFMDSYEFIENHPAFLGGIFSGIRGLEIHAFECCENGEYKHSPIYLYRDDERFEDFLGKGHPECLDSESPKHDHVEVPYEDYYGKKWEFDHIEFSVEGGAHYYDPEVKAPWFWQRFHDSKLNVKTARSYEDAIIQFADKVKNVYGDYSYSEFDDNSIIPQWIKDNNKEFPAFDIDNLESIFKDGKMNRNPKNIHLTSKEVNDLWWYFIGNKLGFFNGEVQNTFGIMRYLNKEAYEAITNLNKN